MEKKKFVNPLLLSGWTPPGDGGETEEGSGNAPLTPTPKSAQSRRKGGISQVPDFGFNEDSVDF